MLLKDKVDNDDDVYWKSLMPLMLSLFSYVVWADDVGDGNDYGDLCLFYCLIHGCFLLFS